jgi:hypothetical protein
MGGENEGGLLPLPRSGPLPGETLQIPFLSEILTILAVVALLVAVAYVLVNWRQSLGIILTVVALFGLSYLLFLFLSWLVGSPGMPILAPGNGSILGGGGGGSGPVRRSPESLILLLVLVLAALGAVASLLGTATDDGEASERSDEGTADAAAVGRAAGRAADRLEGETDIENEVYRTWREMTELLDVDRPGTSTPGEFATAAIEAGLGREDVDELTRLFEDVRYGETRPSEAHERRAIAVFRRIEGRYAEEDPDSKGGRNAGRGRNAQDRSGRDQDGQNRDGQDRDREGEQ